MKGKGKEPEVAESGAAPDSRAAVKLAQRVAPHRLVMVIFRDAGGVEVGRTAKCELTDGETVSVAGPVPAGAAACDLHWGGTPTGPVYNVRLAGE